MKKILLLALLTGCVGEGTPLDYAKRAHPECSDHRVVAHRLSAQSQSEVTMKCGETVKTIAIKCVHGWGILADTTCHENN